MDLPSFLESKQSVSPSASRIGNFFRNKTNASIFTLVVLLFAIPLTVWLVQMTQIFAPRAAAEPIQLVTGDESCVISTNPNKVGCATFPIKLTSPYGPPVSTQSAFLNFPPEKLEFIPEANAQVASPTLVSATSSCINNAPAITMVWQGGPGGVTWYHLDKLVKGQEGSWNTDSSLGYSASVRGPATTGLISNEIPGGAGNLSFSTTYVVKVRAQIGENNASSTVTSSGSNRIEVVTPASCPGPSASAVVSPSPSASSATSPSPSASAEGSASPAASVGASPSAIASSVASPTATASTSVSPSPNLPGTVSYKIAETEAGLATASAKFYTSHPLITDFTFSSPEPGFKQIWVEFLAVDGQKQKEHISVEMVPPPAVPTSLECSMDLAKQNLNLTIKGSKFGESSGKVTVNTKEAQIKTWGDQQVTATIVPDGGVDDGKVYKVKLTTSDSQILPEMICQINTTLISLGAKLFCRQPGEFEVNGVQVLLADENGNKANETLTIDKDGIIKNLKTKLQTGKLYVVSIKAPNSLRRNALFIAEQGTNIIGPGDSTSFILPVGDIAPTFLADGKINTLDRAEIVRQWSVLGLGSGKTGDFNRDSRVNSIDWACMRYDFNKEDDGIPQRASYPSPQASPTPMSSVSSPAPSASACVPVPACYYSNPPCSFDLQPGQVLCPVNSPQPSAGQRAAYFLLTPSETGSYPNGDEFFVDVNVWSQNEAANLFVAKIGFDATALEVVRIEKGTALTSWVEDFFDNQSGEISLIAGLPSPGLKTTENNAPRMARVVFRAKKVGVTSIVVDQGSNIYSNADNQNILTTLMMTDIAITN